MYAPTPGAKETLLGEEQSFSYGVAYQNKVERRQGHEGLGHEHVRERQQQDWNRVIGRLNREDGADQHGRLFWQIRDSRCEELQAGPRLRKFESRESVRVADGWHRERRTEDGGANEESRVRASELDPPGAFCRAAPEEKDGWCQKPENHTFNTKQDRRRDSETPS